MSVSGVPVNRKAYGGILLGGTDHLRHTQDLSTRAFVRGCATTGAELADELEQRRHSVAAALGEARQKVRRTDLLAIDAELPPNLPQQVTLETNAASNWGAVVTVVDSLE